MSFRIQDGMLGLTFLVYEYTYSEEVLNLRAILVLVARSVSNFLKAGKSVKEIVTFTKP